MYGDKYYFCDRAQPLEALALILNRVPGVRARVFEDDALDMHVLTIENQPPELDAAIVEVLPELDTVGDVFWNRVGELYPHVVDLS